MKVMKEFSTRIKFILINPKIKTMQSNNMSTMLLKFKKPFPDEHKCRFIVIEDREDELLVQEISVCADLTIKPTYVYKKTELIYCKEIEGKILTM